MKKERKVGQCDTWFANPTPHPMNNRPKMSMATFAAPELKATPARKARPPTSMLILRPCFLVTQEAQKVDTKPAM